MPIKDFAQGMDFGLGVDDLTGAVRGPAVTAGPPQEVAGTGGQTVTFELQKIESLQDLQTSLGLSVDAQGSYGLFSASDKFNFSQSSHLKTYSVFLLVHVKVLDSFRQIENEQLTPVAAQLISNGQNDRFREEFGDLYVKGLQTGGEYFAVLEIETKDSDDQQSISNSLDAGGFFGTGSVDVAIQFSTSVKNISSNHSTHIHSFQQGGGDTSVQTDVDSVITKAKGFGANVLAKPFPYTVFLQDYKALNLPAPPNFIDLQNAKDVLQEISNLRTPLLVNLNDIDFILTNPLQFEKPSTDLSVLRNQVATAINQLTSAASQCVNNLKACAAPQVDIPNLRLIPHRLGAPSVNPVLSEVAHLHPADLR